MRAAPVVDHAAERIRVVRRGPAAAVKALGAGREHSAGVEVMLKTGGGGGGERCGECGSAPVKEHAIGAVLKLLQYGVAVDNEVGAREEERGDGRHIALVDRV